MYGYIKGIGFIKITSRKLGRVSGIQVNATGLEFPYAVVITTSIEEVKPARLNPKYGILERSTKF